MGQALSPLASSNLRSNQEAIAGLQSLASQGRQQVEDVFRTILSEDSVQVEPLHYVTKREMSLEREHRRCWTILK